MELDKVLEIASRITHPITAAVFAIALSAFLCLVALRKRRAVRQHPIIWLLAFAILVLGLAPIATRTYLQSIGLYRVRVFVLGVDGQAVDSARVTSSAGGEPKKVQSG